LLAGATSNTATQAKDGEASGRAARKAKRRAKSKDKQKKIAEEKLRKAALASDPAKREKNRKRMLIRADKLEAKAKKLMSEAAKARARAKVLGEKTKVSGGHEHLLGGLVTDTADLGTARQQEQLCSEDRGCRDEGRRELVKSGLGLGVRLGLGV
jgi:hypothetical protein